MQKDHLGGGGGGGVQGHTPGPWFHATSQGQVGSVEDGHGNVVAQTQQITPNDHARRNADARLIAAAPDGHEANKAALMVLCALERANDWHPNTEKDIAFAIEACRAAIAKAEEAKP